MSLADKQFPVLHGLGDSQMAYLDSVGKRVELAAGAQIFDEDEPAHSFYIIESGRVGLEVPLPAGPSILVDTLGDGELLGLSWLAPPHRWNWRARSLDDTKAFSFDAAAVREQCARDPQLALHIYRVVATESLRRLHTTRIRLLDLYRSGDR